MFKRSYTRSISQTGAAPAPASTDSNNRHNLQRGAGGDGDHHPHPPNKPDPLNQVTGQQQQSIRASKLQKIQFKSSFCKIIIAISTIKGLASNSTSTGEAPTATHNISFLISLLKLFLSGLYYLLALASLIMLISYMNHLGQTQTKTNHNNDSSNNTAQQPEAIMLNAPEVLQPPPLVRVGRSVRETGDGLTIVTRLTDGSSSNDVGQPNAESNGHPTATRILNPHHGTQLAMVAGGVPNRSSNVPLVMMLEHRLLTETRTFQSSSSTHKVQQQQQPKQDVPLNRKKIPPEAGESLPENQRSHSANNRGSIMIIASNYSTSTIKPHPSQNNINNNNNHNDQGKWIPIVDNRLAVAESTRQPQIVLPSQTRHPKVSANQNPLATGESMPPSPPVASSVDTPMISEETNSRYDVLDGPPRHFESHYHDHRHHHHQQHHYHHNRNRNYPANTEFPPIPAYNTRHWRRPRFNPDYDGPPPPPPPPRVNKLYKVVLLCDKTLVSLDYLKRIHFEPKPMVHHHDNDFDENDIDLDSNLDPIFAASRRHANITTPSSSSSSLLLSSSSEINSDSSTVDNSDSDHKANTETMEKRSHLTEEDPLVRCDMWDLEKGLKNRKPPREILQMAIKADFDTVRDAINRCRQLSEQMLPPDDEYRDGLEIMSTEDLISLFSMKRGLIPGTKWCGLGDIASNYNDLGPKHRIDICCRAHDHCPIRLKPFRNDYGVLNIALYTKSHCDCDADFYRCLREVHSRTADMLGNLYFNVMKLQCMREERMKICSEMRPIALGFERCIRYEESPMRTVFKFTTPPVAY